MNECKIKEEEKMKGKKSATPYYLDAMAHYKHDNKEATHTHTFTEK